MTSVMGQAEFENLGTGYVEHSTILSASLRFQPTKKQTMKIVINEI